MRRLLSIILCMVLLIGVLPTTALADEAVASVMRLEKCEGDVTVKNASGKTLKITDQMRLYNNYEISTDRKSYAYISLDGTKAIKLDASTKVSISKAGRKLEILVSSGKLLFDVSAPLENDESMEIRTSTMMTGVRGTIGYVEILNVNESTLTLLEGLTRVTTVDPSTGESTVTEVRTGQTLNSQITDRDGEETLTLVISELKEDDIPGFACTYVADNDDVQHRLEENSDLNVGAIIDTAEAKEDDDEAAAEEQADLIQNQMDQLETDAVDPLFEEQNDQTTNDNYTAPVTPPINQTVYSVVFNTGGIGTAPATQTVNLGSTITEPAAPTADGYTFGGWFKDADCTIPWDFETDTVTAATTLYAKWTAVTSYTVTFDMGGIGTEIPAITVADGSTITEPAAPTADGYTFGGWFKDADCTIPWDFETDTVTAATTLYAKWTAVQSIALNNPTTADLIAALQQAAASADINTVSIENAALELDEPVTVPDGETLELISGSITNNDSLTVSGTITAASDTTLENSGTISVNSANSLHVLGSMTNNGTIVVGGFSEDTGEPLPGLLDISGGTLYNYGTIRVTPQTDSQIVNNNGYFHNSGEFNITSEGVYISGGVYTDDRAVLCAVVSNTKGISYIGPLADLMEWPDGSEVKLVGGQSGTLPVNNTVNEPMFLVQGTVTLDLNGRTLDTGSHYLQIGGEFYDEVKGAYTVEGSLTVINYYSGGTITSSDSYRTVVSYGDFTLRNGTIENTYSGGTAIYPHGSGLVTINGGSVVGDNAISSFGISGNASSIVINDGTITGANCAVNNEYSGGTLTINGGEIYGTNSVFIHNNSVEFTGGRLLTQFLETFDAMNLELPQPSSSTVDDMYVIDLSKDPTIWELADPTEDEFRYVLGKEYVRSILLSYANMTLTGEYFIPENKSIDVLSGNMVIDKDTLIEVAGNFYAHSNLFNHGTLKVTQSTDENGVTSTGILQHSSMLKNIGTIIISNEINKLSGYICHPDGELINSGTFLDYSYTSNAKGSYVVVRQTMEDQTSRDVYIGAADGTAWLLTGAASCTAEFYVLDDSTMYIPDQFNGAAVELYNVSAPFVTAKIATKTGMLTLINGSNVTLCNNLGEFSIPTFHYTGSITVDSSTLSAVSSKFVSPNDTTLISVRATNLDIPGLLDLIACSIVHNWNTTAIEVQDSQLRLSGLYDEVNDAVYRSTIDGYGNGITADSTSSVGITALNLNVSGIGLELRGSGNDGSYINNSTIAAGAAAVIAESPDTPISFFNCTITSNENTALANYGMVTIEDCVLTGATAALYNNGHVTTYGDYNQFILNDVNATPNTYALHNDTNGDSSEVYGTFKAKSVAQLFYGVSVTNLPTAPDADGWYVCTLTAPT